MTSIAWMSRLCRRSESPPSTFRVRFTCVSSTLR